MKDPVRSQTFGELIKHRVLCCWLAGGCIHDRNKTLRRRISFLYRRVRISCTTKLLKGIVGILLSCFRIRCSNFGIV